MKEEKKQTTVGLSKDTSERIQKYLKEISSLYGVIPAEIEDFVRKEFAVDANIREESRSHGIELTELEEFLGTKFAIDAEGKHQKEEIHIGLSKDTSERIQKYLKEISRIYGISLMEIGDFLEKKLESSAIGEHQWFMAFTIIDEIFDEMVAKIMTALEAIGAIEGIWSTKDHAVNPSSPESESKYGARRRLFKSIIRETQDRIKEELPLPKHDKKEK